MCTIAILFGVAEFPLILAANRDELYAREARGPQVLVDTPRVAGGLDVLSGGTWLAVRELAAADDQDAYVAALDPRRYASMNLLWGDAEHVSVAYLRREGGKEIQNLPRGLHVLCNDRLGAPGFPRGERFAIAIERALARSRAWPPLAQTLAIALGDHTRVPIEAVPPSELSPQIARELTATCIHSEHYGTRSSTLVAIDRGSVNAYLHADGPPCVTPFVDRMELLR
jgi:uncharacterized protein with NRDE domain